MAEHNGNHLRECWTEVLRCVSRFELLQQLTAGVPTDALLFAMPDKTSAADKLKRRILRRGPKGGEDEAAGGLAHDSFSSINDMGLHAGEAGRAGGRGWLERDTCLACLPSLLPPPLLTHFYSPSPTHSLPPSLFPLPLPGGREVDKKLLPPAEVMASVDVQELNRLFVHTSQRLDSEAIVAFVQTLSAIAAEELRPVACPRVFSLTKIVEIAHFNMGRIRYFGGCAVVWVERRERSAAQRCG